MTRSALQPNIFRALQSGTSNTPQLNPVIKFKKFFCASLAILLFISPVFADETGLFPASAGTLMDSYLLEDTHDFDVSGAPLIVHIQDAHGSLSVQKNIAAIIGFLVREHGFQAVYEEGNTGHINTREVFWMPEAVNRKLAEDFLKEGKITGAEYAHIAGNQGFELFGAEVPALYEKNMRLRRQMLSYGPAAAGYLADIGKNASREASRVFSGNLRRYLRKSELFWKGWGDVPFPVSGLNKNGIAPDRVLDRLEAFDAAERSRNITNEAEQKAFERLELISVMKRVAALQATRQDLEYYAGRREAVGPLVKGKPVLAEYLRLADLYYELALRRDDAMMGRVLKGMASRNERRVILVSGGFHSAGLTELMKKREVSYAVIAPTGFPAAAHTVREPNLFNLPVPEARLLANLRGLEIARGTNPHVYRLMKQDISRLNQSFEYFPPVNSGLPAGVAKNGTVMLLLVGRIQSEEAAARMIQRVSALARSNQADFVLWAKKRTDVRALLWAMRANIKDPSVSGRIRIQRLLTPADFESARNGLQGRQPYLLGSRDDLKRLKLGGIPVEQYLPLEDPLLSGSQGLLYDEIERLQRSHRAFVTSA